MENPMTQLETCIASLERRNRILFLSLTGIMSIILLGAITRVPDETKIMQAERFELSDSDGCVRAEMALRDNQPVFAIKDENGRDRLEIKHDAEETGVFIRDETGTIRIGAAQFAHGGGGFALHGPESKGAAVLYYKSKGSLSSIDDAGNMTLRIPETKK